MKGREARTLPGLLLVRLPQSQAYLVGESIDRV